MWLRFAPYDSVRPARNDSNVSLLVGIQPSHYLTLGVSGQDKLVGFGTIDSVISEADTQKELWSFEKAVSFATEQFEGFISNRGGSPEERRGHLLLEMIEDSDFSEYGQSVISPNGGLCQELLIPTSKFVSLCKDSETDVLAFLFVNEIILQLVTRGNLDRQPFAVNNFAVEILMNRKKPPKRIDKGLSYITRNRLIVAIVKGLVKHGIQLTRNDTSNAESAFDAVAIAARKSRLLGAASFDSIKKIYYVAEVEAPLKA